MIADAAQKSGALFASGYYCAESVLLAIVEATDIQSNVIPQIATGFCSGVSRTCRLCGALSGAIMGIGIIAGRSTPEDTAEKTYGYVNRLLERFEAQHGSTNCQQLTGCDLGTERGQREFLENNIFNNCRRYTESATELALQLLDENSR